MKKINLILGALVCLFAFSACTDEVDYTPATAESAKGVYFPSTLPSQIDLTTDGTTFDVQICRTDTVGEETVALQVETSDTANIFTIPSSVTFVDGQSSANITIAYDAEKLGYNYLDVTLSVAVESASAYGGNTYAFTAGIPEPWESLGMATFTDAFFFYDTYQVEVQQNKLNPYQFRLVKPYHEALEVDDNGYWGGPWENTSEYMNFNILQPGETLGEVAITEEDLVYFAPFNTGWNNPSYGAEVMLYHPAHFSSLASEENFTYNYVVSYQENGLPAVVQLAPMYYMDGVGGWNKSQEDGWVTIVFPGVVIKDYSVGIDYSGRFTDPSDNVYADFAVTKGADASVVKVGMALSEDPNAVLSGILDGSIESVEVAESGTVRFAIGEPGVYTAVAISYDAEGNPQEANYAQFEYTAAGAPVWNSLGMAQYSEAFISCLFTDVPTVTYEVEIQEQDGAPGVYRLVNPYGAAYPYNEAGDWDSSKDYYLEINAADPEGVYIPSQNLGFDWGYGFFYASSSAGYYLEQGAPFDQIKSAGLCGTLVDGVITFPTQTLLVTAESLDGWYSANYSLNDANEVIEGSGDFKVVLPSAASKSSKSVKSFTKQVVNKSKVGGQKLSRQAKMRFVDFTSAVK